LPESCHYHQHHAPPQGEPPVGIATAEHLAEHLAEFACPSMAVVCVGNEICGDDGAGVLVARQLAGQVPWSVYDTQTVPESFLMKIVDRRPESVILIDAIDFGARPGAVDVIDAGKIGGQGPSTHGPAPVAFFELLQMMVPCRRAVVGIQPQNVEFGSAMTQPVAEAAEMVVRAFKALAADSKPDQPA